MNRQSPRFLAPLSLLTITTALLAAAPVAFAAGDAGCGLGSLIIQKNTLLSQLFAVTSNVSFGSQTFGMTSGTSNCKVNGFAMLDKKEVMYAETNYSNLVIEMAAGSGENLSAFAQVLGCSDAAVPRFGQLTQKNYQVIFPTPQTSPSEMLMRVKSQITADPVLSQQCRTIG